MGGRVGQPLKMTSVISLPRRLLALCEPSTHFTASTTFDLPDPLGPTTTQIPLGKSNRVRSAKLLKPESSRALSMGEDFGLGIGDFRLKIRFSQTPNPKSAIRNSSTWSREQIGQR